jgi:hypothetical protein
MKLHTYISVTNKHHFHVIKTFAPYLDKLEFL